VRISIVTPNLNQGAFLAQTIDSVIAADHGQLEYIVVDGGSTDNSREVIAARRARLSTLIMEPDKGLYDAISKGFSRSKGEIMGWLNSGDALFPHSLSIMSEIFCLYPKVEWITSRMLSFLDENGRLVQQNLHHGVSRASYYAGEHLAGFSRGRSLSLIQQESTFWRRSLWDRCGARLDTSLRLAADFELWLRFFKHAELWSVSAPLGAFRRHAEQSSRVRWPEYFAEARSLLESYGARPRNALLQTLSVGLRVTTPRDLRPIAHRLGIFAPAPCCEFDSRKGTWRLTRF
jgi:glycosyltransferase involved in cell wall biosynthesis